MTSFIARIRRILLKRLNFSLDQMSFMATGRQHSMYMRRHRMTHVLARVRLLALVFALAVALWIIVDVITLPWPVWGYLALLRLFSTGVLLFLVFGPDSNPSYAQSIAKLGILLFLPPLFYLAALPFLGDVQAPGVAGQVVLEFYTLLPFIVVAGLAVFPLTILELGIFGGGALVMSLFGMAISGMPVLPDFVGQLWLVLLLAGAASFASLSQLRYMLDLVAQASQDSLSRAYTRRSGSEIIDLHFKVSTRQDAPFTVVFFDIDNFKAINDTYGHEVGDDMLRNMAARLREVLRRGDLVVRWGGEEFVGVFPNTDAAGVRIVIDRILNGWFGARPDGTPLTASMGIAERIEDQVGDWTHLIELADRRMYLAKTQGKARAVSCGDREIAMAA
ncbi:MAG: diguanylate cyclase [Magnetospiraceae bacterium]